MATEKKETKEKEVTISEKKRSIALALNLFFGWMGGHRFYTGQIGSAIAMMFTMGGFGMVWFYDFVTLLLGSYKDKANKPVTAWI
jgi:TM2 domain-containing membrane protein YozV